MLDDTVRKVYRVLYNLHRSEWFASELGIVSRISMRSEQQVKDSVNWLVKEGYLQWNKADNMFRVPFK